jgi:hypothetical protein
VSKEATLVRVADLPPADESARLRLRAWLQERRDSEDVLQQSELAREALEHFLPDASFTQALAREKLPAMVYEEAKRVIGTGRVHPDNEPSAERETHRGGVAAAKSKWHRWFEHVDDRHVRLTAMTRGDLLRAAEEREQRGDGEYVKARHWRRLAADMETDWETVGQRFSEAEIDAALEAAQGGQ